MSAVFDDADINAVSLCGYHIALRIDFVFPVMEYVTWPRAWVDHYARQRLVTRDPVLDWAQEQQGMIRWSEIKASDPMKVLLQARAFGLRYGAAVSHREAPSGTMHSFGVFARSDREFNDDELTFLFARVRDLHQRHAPPKNLTKAELEALRFLHDGLRQKDIALRLGVTEGAIKQRLSNAKRKLSAQTATQAASLAHEYRLI